MRMPPGSQVLEVGLQGGGVHGDEGVELVAGRVDVVAAEVDLEAGDAGQGAGRGANFGGEVGQRADVVAEDGRGVGELRAGELHAVAGVAGQTNRCFGYILDGDGADEVGPASRRSVAGNQDSKPS